MTPTLFSISYAGFWGQSALSLTDFIKHAGKLGYPSVMIAGKRPHLSPLDATPEFVKPIQDALNAVPFGTGCIDYAAFFKGLRDGGFDGTAVFEMCSSLRGGGSLENLDACASTYLKWMEARQFT